jgi:hypothetical protein
MTIPTFEPDAAQRAVIAAPPSAFLSVAAPPGAGKTAVACARIAALVAQGVPASAILMLSFTRVAVAEFRERLARRADEDADLRGVEVTTLDAQTWRVLHGLGDGEAGAQGFDFDIAALRQRLDAGDEAMLAWFGSFRHVLVDEAQDLVGPRAELVAAILQRRHPDCGATVFADDAQAIYGFTMANRADATAAAAATSFAQALAARGLAPERRELTTIHRTDDPALSALFVDARAPLAAGDGGAAFAAVQALIRQHAHEDRGDWEDLVAGLDGLAELVLVRSRLQALLLSQRLRERRSLPHRLRLPGHPVVLEPWIGRVLADAVGRTLTADDFRGRWDRHADEPCLLLQPRTADDAWQQLVAIAGDPRGRVDLHRLRRQLARSRPPLAVAGGDPGLAGPTIGTIHASKGREAQRVTLCLGGGAPRPEDALEEAKVLYVGATRATERLSVAQPPFAMHSEQTDAGRIWREAKGELHVEVGRDGDVDGPESASLRLHASPERCAEAQAWLAARAAGEAAVTLVSPGRGDWGYRIGLDAIRRVGMLTPALNGDLFAILAGSKWHRGRKPPSLIQGIWCCGATTVCLPPDDPRLAELHPPHCESGFLLAPVVRGFVSIHPDMPVPRNRSW